MPYTSNLSYFHAVGKEPLRPLTLGNLVESIAAQFPNRDAVISLQQDHRVTFYETLRLADQFAAGLHSIGLQQGDRLGIWAPNLVEWYIIHMACARAGLILVTINPANQLLDLEYCINKVDIKAIVCLSRGKYQNFYETLTKIAPELSDSKPGNLNSKNVPSLKSVILLSDDKLGGTYTYKEVLNLGDEYNIQNVRNMQHLIQPDDPCYIMFTSGTTGKPKAAVISHFQVVNNSFQLAKVSEINDKHHKACAQMPFFHVAGALGLIGTSLVAGLTLVIPSQAYSPKENLKAIKSEGCTVMVGTPTMYVDLINLHMREKEDLCLETAVTTGASCSPELFKQMLEILKVQKVKSVFGLTECGTFFYTPPNEDDMTNITTTVGHLGDHFEAKVVDEKGNIVPFGTPGELCVRGYTTMLGYWGDDEKTKEILSYNGWLKTGDQFILQKNGYGKVVGRLKELIIRGGENVYPKEIEDLLDTHPDIVEAHVIGLHHQRLGEEVCACIRLRQGTQLTPELLTDFCKDKIARFKIPTQLRILQEFPRTSSGKVQKYKLKVQLEANGL